MKKIAILSAVLLLSACSGTHSGPSAAAPSAPAPAAPAGDAKTVVAHLDGEDITEADLNKAIAGQLSRIQSEIYQVKKDGLDQMIEDKLLEKEAKKRNLVVEALLKVEVLDKVGEISDQEIADFYNQNKARVGNRTLEELKQPIKQQLFAHKASVYRNNLIDRLKSAANIDILLEAPTVDVSIDDDPMKGSKDAKVTIIEFTDYQCPFCGKARPIVKELISDYGDKIHYVLRDFPLEFHPFAKKAAEAADCAGDQGKYWEYSDILWANQGALQVPDLKKYAGSLNLDQKKFDECLDQDKFSAEVEKDQADGMKAGVNGTPSFFINGQAVTGALPIEKFKEIIDSELKKKKS